MMHFEQVKAKVLTYQDDYKIGRTGARKGVAPLLYKTLMHFVTPYSNATDKQLRANLLELSSNTVPKNGNFDKIHFYFD